MKKKARPRPDDTAQSKAFIEKAREIGADGESYADAVMGRLAHTPPKPYSKPGRKAKPRRKAS